MPIDLATLLTSASITAAGVGVLGYTVKKSIEKVLDAKLQKYRIDIQETSRRQASIYDSQQRLLITAVEMIMQARESAIEIRRLMRKATDLPKEKNWRTSDEIHFIAHTLEGFESYSAAYAQLMRKNRVLFPQDLYPQIHEFEGGIHQFAIITKRVIQGGDIKSPHDQRFTQIADEQDSIFLRLDNLYKAITKNIQARIGVAAG